VRIIHGDVVCEDVYAGGILGEMAIVDEGMPRSASAIAMTHAELIKVDASQLVTLIMSAPDFALRVMRVMTRRLRRMNERASPSGWETVARPIVSWGWSNRDRVWSDRRVDPRRCRDRHGHGQHEPEFHVQQSCDQPLAPGRKLQKPGGRTLSVQRDDLGWL
jgi:hypothetical protein